MKKIKLLSILIVLLLISCSINRVIESNGDKALKSRRTNKNNHYIGVSLNGSDFEKAWGNALSSAHSQIANDLGINVKVSSVGIYRVIEKHDFNTAVSMINTEIKIESEHNIQSKVTRFYIEKKPLMGNIVYDVWVEVFFDKESFYAGYQEFWNLEIASLKITAQKLDSAFMQNYQRISTLKNRFEAEKVYLQNSTINQFNALYDQYYRFFNSQKQSINMQNMARKQKFSNLFVFKIYNKTTNETLNNFPVYINNIPFSSNAQGIINYQADFSYPVIATIGHGKENSFVVYQNNAFSPYENKNISLRIRATDKNLENSFQKIMAERGYDFNANYDVMLEIKHQKNTNRISVTQYITELRLEIILTHKNKKLRTIYIPLNSNETINGFGKNENESVLSAYTMEYYVQRKQAIDLLEQSIRSELIISE